MKRTLLCFCPGLALLSLLAAQEVDTSAAPVDTLAPVAPDWIDPLTPSLQSITETAVLILPWDEWGHSDLAVLAANPFVPADIRVGAARLDGSLGLPVLSLVIPSSVTPGHSIDFHGDSTQGTFSNPYAPDILAFEPAPLGADDQREQTYFFWDQGDFQYRDVQVGATAILAGNRRLVLAGRNLGHPGKYGLSGPEPGRYAGNSALQTYMFDTYRSAGSPVSVRYTLVYQKERTGLPFIGETLTADLRRNRTWVQGVETRYAADRWRARAGAATMFSDLTTRTYLTEGYHLNRRSLSFWSDGAVDYAFAPWLELSADWQGKQRQVADAALGFQRVQSSQGRAGAALRGRSWIGYAGLALTDGRLAPEGQLALQTPLGQFALNMDVLSFIDYPHLNRRATLDSTRWLAGPVLLRRAALTYRLDGARGAVQARLMWLATDDERQAASGELAADWMPWKDVLGLQANAVAVYSENERLFPTRINGHAGLIFTLPVPRSRARPFIRLSTTFIYNDFTWWADPRFGDLAQIMAPTSDTISMTAWVSGEMGVKVANFELRFRRFNLAGNVIQNSPVYLNLNSLSSYSLTWRFLASD